MTIQLHSILQAAPSPGATAAATGNASTTPTVNPPDPLADKTTFLKLLIAQLQNQDPLNPTDPTKFVGQLTQYSELEQLIQINQGIQTLTGGDPSKSGTGGSGGSSPSNPSPNPFQNP